MRLTPEITAVFPVPNDDDGAEITIVHLNAGQIEDIHEKMGVFKTIMKRVGDRLEPEIHQNSQVGDKRYTFVVEAVKAWKGFKDHKGKDLPCDFKSKIAVARSVDVTVTRENGRKERINFALWVAECRAELDKQVAAGSK